MKIRSFIVLMMVVCASSFGQDTINNFIIENNKVVWQKVFDTPFTFDQLVDQFKDKGIFETYEISENKIMGDLKLVDADYEGAGYKRMNTQIYLTINQYRGFSVIEYREGRYRVTLKTIELIQNQEMSIGHVGKVDHIETYANRGSEFKRQFREEASIILNYTFANLFTIKKDEEDIW